MINVGVIGLGMMGLTHLDAYAAMQGVKVIAVADADPNRLAGRTKAQGNVEGQAQGKFDITAVQRYTDAQQLIDDPQVQAVDICLPTPLHRRFALACVSAGKNFIVEKPLARTSADAFAIADAVEKTSLIAMPAMCMRFWPGWTWLKDTIERGTYGKVMSARFTRVASHPGGAFYADAAASGAAALDLHVHDTDFVQFLFGIPKSVRSIGYSKVTGGVDHIWTHYQYDNVPMVTAEGGWAMAPGFTFRMQFMVNFERATAAFDSSAATPMMLSENGKTTPMPVESVMGYQLELAYFIDCIRTERKPSTVTLRDAANAIRIIEAEVQSVATGQAVTL